jgi:hypothetical protein
LIQIDADININSNYSGIAYRHLLKPLNRAGEALRER